MSGDRPTSTIPVAWLLLAVSVTFNAFFAIGALDLDGGNDPGGETSAPSGPEEPSVPELLGLDPAQAETYEQLRADRTAYDAVLTEELDRRTADLLKALDPEASADPDRIESIFQDIAEIERQRRDAAGERFMEFVRLLSPEQRERLMRAMRDNRDRRERRPEGPPRWVVEKFDADRDGHLDDDERRAIKEFFDAQRAARRDRIRERLRALELEHFDADGDGVLGADERAAMLDRFDHDGNGELDPRERWEMGRRLDPALDRDDDRGRGRSPEGRRGPRPDRDHR